MLAAAAAKGRLLHFRAVASPETLQPQSQTMIRSQNARSPRAPQKIPGSPRATNAFHRHSRRITQQLRQPRLKPPFDKPTRYICPPRSPGGKARFPKLSVRTQPQMLKAVDVSPPRRKRPIPIPKLKCDQLTPNLPRLANGEIRNSPQSQQLQKQISHKQEGQSNAIVVRPPPRRTHPPKSEASLRSRKTPIPIPKLATAQLTQNLPRLRTGESRHSPQQRSHMWPPREVPQPPYQSPPHHRVQVMNGRVPGSPRGHASLNRRAPMVREPRFTTAHADHPSYHAKPGRRYASAPPPPAHAPVDVYGYDYDEPPSFGPPPRRVRAAPRPKHYHHEHHEEPNVAMLQMQIQQQQQQLLLQQQQMAIIQMQREMERHNAETRARLSREPDYSARSRHYSPRSRHHSPRSRDFSARSRDFSARSRDFSARSRGYSPRSHGRRSPRLMSPRARTAAPRRVVAHGSDHDEGDAMQVVLSIEDVRLERAIKCAMIVRLAPGSKKHCVASNVDFQPQKTEVTTEVTDNPEFHSSTFIFRLPSTSADTTCKFVLRLFGIDEDTKQRSVVGIGILPIASIGGELRKNRVYKDTILLKMKSGEVAGSVVLCIVCRD